MILKFKNKAIFYQVSGAGKPVVMLHGFLESSRIWDDFLPEFSKYGQVLTLDLPGHGQSECIQEVHSMELMAETVHGVLKAIGVKKADFVGHSMGGYVALAFLELYPDMVNSIMLLNSTPTEDSEEKKEIRERSIEVVKKNKQAYISMAISNLLTPKHNELFSKEVEQLKETAYDLPAEGIIAALKGMKIRTNKTAVLAAFTGGKIIVAGKEDPIMDIQDIKKLAIETGAFFVSLPGGHLSYMESREAFANLCISSKK